MLTLISIICCYPLLPQAMATIDLERSEHGYDASFVHELDPKYTCPVCLLVLRDPVQTKCGHRFCKLCLKRSNR